MTSPNAFDAAFDDLEERPVAPNEGDDSPRSRGRSRRSRSDEPKPARHRDDEGDDEDPYADESASGGKPRLRLIAGAVALVAVLAGGYFGFTAIFGGEDQGSTTTASATTPPGVPSSLPSTPAAPVAADLAASCSAVSGTVAGALDTLAEANDEGELDSTLATLTDDLSSAAESSGDEVFRARVAALSEVYTAVGTAFTNEELPNLDAVYSETALFTDLCTNPY